jgi:hypothetical protein
MSRWGKEKMPFPFMVFKPIEIVSLESSDSIKHEMNLQRFFDLTFPGSYALKVEWFGYDENTKKNIKYISSDEIVFTVH